MAVADITRREALPADEFIKELEGYRHEFLKGKTLRVRKTYKNKEEVIAAKRKRHVGGTVHNHKFVAEKYLNCEDKELRRINLRKLVDECGQTSVGVGLPSHPRLARWGSQAFGLTDAEIEKLEKEDNPPETFMWQVTKVGLHRSSSWPIAIAMSMVGEGEKLNPAIRQQLLDHIEELKREYTSFGVEDVDKALAFEIEHAGVDVDHAEIAVTAIRKYINTPELQDEMRRAYKLTLQQGHA
jgi:pyrroloquinoline quinone (PQQ) biosynthesis protein C